MKFLRKLIVMVITIWKAIQLLLTKENTTSKKKWNLLSRKKSDRKSETKSKIEKEWGTIQSDEIQYSESVIIFVNDVPIEVKEGSCFTLHIEGDQAFLNEIIHTIH